METEEKIVYSIMETVRNGQLNDDLNLNERTVRSYLASYRAALIKKYSENGITISEQCFQSLGRLKFDYFNPREFRRKMENVIRLENSYGVVGLMVEKYGENIPVVNSEEYHLSRKSIIEKYHPKGKFLGTFLTIYIGQKNLKACTPSEGLNEIIQGFEEDIIETGGSGIYLEVNAILVNPDQAESYDWTADPYPMDSESVAELKNEILRREYGIVLQTKTDKVTDGDERPE